MRVAVVGYELEGERTGVGRYLAGLLRGLEEESPEGFRFGVFLHGREVDESLFRGPAIEAIPQALASPLRRVLWEQWQLPKAIRAWGADLVFSPSYSLPPTPGVPGVVTMHDLSFERLPEEFAWRERWRRRWLARRACARAARVLTDTEAMRREVASHYRLQPERVGVVPLAVESTFSAEAAAEDAGHRSRLGVETPYLLYLGALLDRRQPLLMLEAVAALLARRPELRLVVAGPDRMRGEGAFSEGVGRLGLEDRVRRLGFVADDVVPALLRGAEATFYLSTYEGYGLPPLESLACGTPAVVGGAVVGGGLALDELWPDYPHRVAAFDPEAVAASVEALLGRSDEERERERREGIERVGSLSWRKSAVLWLEELGRARGC